MLTPEYLATFPDYIVQLFEQGLPPGAEGCRCNRYRRMAGNQIKRDGTIHG